MPIDHNNMKNLNFLKENYTKADERCTQWFMKNQAKLEKLAELPEKFKGKYTDNCLRHPIEMCVSNFVSQLPSAAVNRRKKPLRDGVIQGKFQMAKQGMWKEVESEPIMIPVSSDVQDILYKPLPNGGRRAYLAQRNLLKPEERYNFCVSSGAECGWRMRESHQALQVATFGRYFTFKHDLRSRTGPHPDPDYYKKPPGKLYSKCPH